MVEQYSDARLTEILRATSDPTRRVILTHLAQEGALRVTEIAARFDMSLNAVSKHIKVLESAGLVSRRTLWREHLIEVQMAPLAEIDHWFAGLRSIWDMRLEALEMIVTKETQMTELSLTTARRISAPAARLFNAWLDPDMLARFMIPGSGMSVPSAKTDPRPGGRFDLVMRDGDKDIPISGTYKEITPHSRLVFSWETPFSVEGSTITLTFTPDGDGTLVELTHVKFASEDSRNNHERGWAAILAMLGKTVA